MKRDEAISKTTQALNIQVTENLDENRQLKSMSSTKEASREALMLASPWPPSPANQLNNKYFVNQVQSNLSSVLQNSNETDASNVVIESTIPTNHAANKYFVSNVSLLSIGNVTESGSSTMSPFKSRIKTTTNPLFASNINKTIQQQQNNHHHTIKSNGSLSTGRTHFQIAQKQLTLSKNVRTEPPPMLNHILDSLSVSNSKHLHHDQRFVS